MYCPTGYLLWIQNYMAGINRKANPGQYEHFLKGGSKMKMTVKAKYKNPWGNISWKYFHNEAEMFEWFKRNGMCKYISKEIGEHVEYEAENCGYNRR